MVCQCRLNFSLNLYLTFNGNRLIIWKVNAGFYKGRNAAMPLKTSFFPHHVKLQYITEGTDCLDATCRNRWEWVWAVGIYWVWLVLHWQIMLSIVFFTVYQSHHDQLMFCSCFFFSFSLMCLKIIWLQYCTSSSPTFTYIMCFNRLHKIRPNIYKNSGQGVILYHTIKSFPCSLNVIF